MNVGRILRALLATAALGSALVAANPPTPAGAINPLPFGVNTFPAGTGTGFTWSAQDTADAVSDIAPGGIVRFTVEWFQLQRGSRPFGGGPCQPLDSPLQCTIPGGINWPLLDPSLAVLADAGLKVVLAPLGAPPWARGMLDIPSPDNQGDPIVMPPGNNGTNLFQWQTFVNTLVQHVETNWPGLLVGIEVWNEQNGKYFWTTPTGPDPAWYKNVLCYAYSGVNTADPDNDVQVIFGGTNPDPPFNYPHKMSVNDFVSGAYAAGAKNCMDSLGIHPYPSLPTGPQPANLAQLVAAYHFQLDNLRQVAINAGDAGRTISVTEVNAFAALPFDEQRMEDFLLQTYQDTELMNDVDMYIVHTLYDTPTSPGGPNLPWGICSQPGVPETTADALKTEITGLTTPADC